MHAVAAKKRRAGADEGAGAAGPEAAPADLLGADPARFDYRPARLLPLVNARLRLADGAVLPAHKELIALRCAAFDASVPELAAATPAAPLVLSEPFAGAATDDAVAFLCAIYTPAMAEGDVALLGVLRLAHALDAKEVMEAGVRFLLALAPGMDADNAIAWDECAERCDVDELLAAAAGRLAELVRAAGNEGATSALAAHMVRECSPRLVAAVVSAVCAERPAGARPPSLLAQASAAEARLRAKHGAGGALVLVNVTFERCTVGLCTRFRLGAEPAELTAVNSRSPSRGAVPGHVWEVCLSRADGLPPPLCLVELVNLSSLETASLSLDDASNANIHEHIRGATLWRVAAHERDAARRRVYRRVSFAIYVLSASAAGLFAPGARAPTAAGGYGAPRRERGAEALLFGVARRAGRRSRCRESAASSFPVS